MNGRLAFGAAIVAAAISFTAGNLSGARGDDAAPIKAQITNVPLPVTAPSALPVNVQNHGYKCNDQGGVPGQTWNYAPAPGGVMTPAVRADVDAKVRMGYAIVGVMPDGTILMMNHAVTCN
jgi:hypothetical protein